MGTGRRWAPYTGQYYGFTVDGEPLVIEEADGTAVSLWRVPVEYGADTYQLKVQSGDGKNQGRHYFTEIPQACVPNP